MMVEEDLKKLILLRLESWPPNVKIALGSGEELSRDQLIEFVKQGGPLGEEIIAMQLRYMRSMKTGFPHE